MKTFKSYEENGSRYYYDRQELKKVFDEAVRQRAITGEKLVGLISEETEIPEETIRNHLRTDSTGSNPDSIEKVKKYGKCLLGNEYALLKHIPKPNEASEKLSEDLHSESIQAIFGMLYDILALYESSDCYNYIPNTENMDGAWDYFEGLIGNARKKVTADFLGKRDDTVCKKLERIIGETEIFVKSYSVPGVVKRWRKINPQINFFDCVFDLIDELGAETAWQMFIGKGGPEIFPGSYVIKARNDYFKQIKFANDNNNLQYSEERIFQNELLKTLAMVFENDFGGKDNSRVT